MPETRTGTLREAATAGAPAAGGLLVTTISPFHCLYRDAFDLHNAGRARQATSAAEANRLARAALLVYLAAADALVHQAAVELGRPNLAPLLSDPSRPLPPATAWTLLPTIAAEVPAATTLHPEAAPWPQFFELLALRDRWTYPGAAPSRAAYYRRTPRGDGFEPLDPHDAPAAIPADAIVFPRTGLPRDPYAFTIRHLDTARAVLDAAVSALDVALSGALTRGNRHRAEPTRPLQP